MKGAASVRRSRIASYLLWVVLLGSCGSPDCSCVHPEPTPAEAVSGKYAESLLSANRSRLAKKVSLDPYNNPRVMIPYSPMSPDKHFMYDIELISVSRNGKVTICCNGKRLSTKVGKWFEGRGSSGLYLNASNYENQTATITAKWIYSTFP
jgi:hypothetical protein